MTTEAVHTLVVLRHAKSDWSEDLPDHERQLAKRGRKDAPVAGKWLRKAGYTPDRVACSTARRARQTWELAAEALRADPEVVRDERIYGASMGGLLTVARETPERVTTLLLVGHKPGMYDFVVAMAREGADELLEQAQHAFPTCAIAVLQFSGAWADLVPGKARLVDFEIPRG
jgi:phosphohistidine phosphatase